jgi:Holliday junction resolvasome RuvABC endonuclease subunit
VIAITGVSFDLSKTRTGICTWVNKTSSGVWHAGYKMATDLGMLLYDWRGTVLEIINPRDPDWMAFEDVRPINKIHMEQHFGMVGVLAMECFEREIPLLRATTSSIKKALAGKGNATKEEQHQAAIQRFPHLGVYNHDEADAVAVGLYVIENLIDWEASTDQNGPLKLLESSPQE